MITHDPLHGSGRAALPHPAFASGRNGQALFRIGRNDSGRREVAGTQARHLFRGYVGGLAAALKRPPPKPADD